MTILRSTLREIGGAFAFAAALSLFVNLASLTVPIYDMQLYDRVMLSRNMDTLTGLSVMCLLGMILYATLEYFRNSLFLVMGDRLARRLDIPSLRAALARSLDGEAAAASQALRDINDLRNFTIGGTATIVLDLLWTPILLGVLLMLHPWYGYFALASALVLVVISVVTDRLTRRRFTEATNAANRSLSALSTTLANAELIDGMGMLPGLARRWLRQQDAAQADLDAASRMVMLFGSLSRTCRLVMQGGIIALGVILVIRHQASPGSMMGANLLVARLLSPFEQLVSGWRQWVSQGAALKRVMDLLNNHDSTRSTEAWGCKHGGLVVDNLSYTPPGSSRQVLSEISFTIEPGEAVAVTGPSASGKSTLVRLILGLVTPSGGHVTLDGRSTHAWNREDFGQHVGYVPQSVALLDGTVFDNISRMADVDAAAVVDAARKAGLHEMIGRLPLGYDTWVGGDSFALSGGQRQRIALARALFGSPRLLVLDEANSSLDHLGDEALAAAILDAKRDGAAILVITHRPAILAVIDRLVVLKQGMVDRCVPPSHSLVAVPAE